jgi:hypothetical protein
MTYVQILERTIEHYQNALAQHHEDLAQKQSGAPSEESLEP